jgi:flavin-dependent dehydrogenase
VPEKYDREVDLLVAGAGPGGMTAALVAVLEGLSVLICEKSDQVGGTASTSAGTLWIYRAIIKAAMPDMMTRPLKLNST